MKLLLVCTGCNYPSRFPGEIRQVRSNIYTNSNSDSGLWLWYHVPHVLEAYASNMPSTANTNFKYLDQNLVMDESFSLNPCRCRMSDQLLTLIYLSHYLGPVLKMVCFAYINEKGPIPLLGVIHRICRL